MLRISQAPVRRVLIRVFVYNLLISFFVAGLLMLRSDSFTWSEFYQVLVPTLIYTFCCGLLSSSAMYLADVWCCRARVSVQIAVLFGLGLLSGTLGEFIGSAF